MNEFSQATLLYHEFQKRDSYVHLCKFAQSSVTLSFVLFEDFFNLHLLTLLLGKLSKDVFERRTSTGSEAFFLFICLDAIKFLSLTFFSLLKTIYPRVLTKPLPNDAKSPLPVDVRRSKTLLLKFPIIFSVRLFG